MLPYKVVAFINGVRFYPSGVTYTAQFGGHASFSIQVPAVPEWQILPPRSHCAVFYADPVSNSYRLLTEGEFIGFDKGKSAVGPRYRALLFRTTHAVWDTIQYAGMVGMTSGKDVTQEAQILAASGYEVRTASPEGGGPATSFDLARTDLIKFITDYSDNSTTFSAFLPAFIRAVMQQTPVDAFYNAARHMARKTFALQDKEIASIVNSELFLALIRDSWAPQNLGQGTTLESIIAAFENIAMYAHTPIPSPPLLRMRADNVNQDIIAETMFVPHLYTVVPPACNVIFRDQVTDIRASENYATQPTRVITQLQAPTELGGGLPYFFVSNDVERSANISNILTNTPSISESNPANRTNSVASAGSIVVHDLLTQEEYHRGVIPSIVNFPLQNLQPISPVNETASAAEQEEQQNEAKARFDLYIQSACRHYYEVRRGASRRASVVCSFLPYVVPGFPCLVEDETGNFYGFISSVTHSLSASGSPQTSLEVTHIREAYVVEGRLRNAMNPAWLNAKFLPENINDTYSKIFGVNAAQAGHVTADGTLKHAAMVPTIKLDDFGTTNHLNSTQQTNMDELASTVMPTPRYSQNGAFVGISSGTVADKIRLSPDPRLAALQFQYRAGTSLTQFMQFHNLSGVSDDSTTGGQISPNVDYVFSKEPLPTDLAPEQEGNPLFGTPYHMTFVGRVVTNKSDIDPTNYGVYKLDAVDGKVVTDIRQRAARTIAAAIARRITNG